MRNFRVLRVAIVAAAAGVLLWPAAGCQRSPRPAAPAADQIDEDEFNDLAVRSAFDEQARAAVVTERSIYGHHFEPGGTALNGLGERQVDILAAAYRDAGEVEINVADDGSPAERRAGRLEAVRQAFLERGLATDALDLVAGRPGGQGLPSVYVIGALTGTDEGLEGGSGGSRSQGSRGGSSGSSGRSSGMSGSSGSYSGGR